ncbi:hypothetical protein BDY17DRAFT_29942 [Neohortaea acidophila]|uniref:Mid2 domain-containing protein n=1 Tax=Neohortaea acidophila TaxID=245834 RepID=A0A6A6PIX6_9PEZI|nr:uncharacterized protein BDY17DRAFT_29942 [Neohortaea acidophila]KAF2479998.1 hypothetical protein BDY17DRAFT_29942 [Neohortaea acidophila]
MRSRADNRPQRLCVLALLCLLSSSMPLANATCYYRSGAVATTYVPCPGVNFCCDETQYCESNGLCRDKNNHANGSVTYFPGKADPGPYNFTGLYQTPTCNNAAFQGCDEECTASDATTFAYIWACTDNLLNYCCHNNTVSLSQRDCCSAATRFQLASPVALIPSSAAPTSSTTTGDPNAPPSQSGLSDSAKIGVGVAVPVVVILVVAATIWFIRLRRTNKHARSQRSTTAKLYQDTPEEQENWRSHDQRTAELENDQLRPELEGRGRPLELPNNTVHELG